MTPEANLGAEAPVTAPPATADASAATASQNATTGEASPVAANTEAVADAYAEAAAEGAQSQTQASEAQSLDEDPFAEFESKPLTAEQINKLWARTPQQMREKFAAAETERARLLQRETDLGGEVGFDLAKTVLSNIRASTPAELPQASEAMFDVLYSSNPHLANMMGARLVDLYLENDQTRLPFANNLIQSQFGPEYNIERIEKLVQADKLGRVDLEDLPTVDESPEVKRLRQELQSVQGELKNVKGTMQTESQRQQAQQQESAWAHVSELMVSEVDPIAERLGWTVKDTDAPELKEAKLAWGELLTAYINGKAQALPAYAAVEDIISNGRGLGPDGKLSRQVMLNAGGFQAFAKASVLELARKLQPLIKLTSLSKTNGNGNHAPAVPKPLAPPNNVPPLRDSAPIGAFDRERAMQERQEAWRAVQQAARG